MSYQPKTGAPCSCKRGIQRDNCPNCEGTGWVIDFVAIRTGMDKLILGTCEGIIDLSRPLGSERRRGYQPPWYTVYIYRCPTCGAKHVIRANSFRGKCPEPSVGAVRCDGPILGSASMLPRRVPA